MKISKTAPNDIDEYIAGFPARAQKSLQRIRTAIHKSVPEAEEAIKYQIPTFTLHGNLVHFAAYKNHIGLYPAPRESAEFKSELAAYAGGKGTVQFPLDKPIPLELIARIVKYLAADNMKKARTKAKKSK